jgi:hypothetical protein
VHVGALPGSLCISPSGVHAPCGAFTIVAQTS